MLKHYKKMKKFTGDRELYLKFRYHLLDEGFDVQDAIHIGDNKYEFEEIADPNKKGCRNLHKILIWEEYGEIKYKTKITGAICVD